MIPKHTNSVINDLLLAMHSLQRSARTLKDIERGIHENVSLFKEASWVLGHPGQWFEDSQSATFVQLELAHNPEVDHSFKNRPFLDVHMKKYQVFSPVAYTPHIAIGFELVLSSVPELGIHFDTSTSQRSSQHRLFFSPAKWPVIASELIWYLYSSEYHKKDAADLIINDCYQSLEAGVLSNLISSGLVSNKGDVCELLLTCVNKSRVLDINFDLPHDFS